MHVFFVFVYRYSNRYLLRFKHLARDGVASSLAYRASFRTWLLGGTADEREEVLGSDPLRVDGRGVGVLALGLRAHALRGSREGAAQQARAK